LKHTRGRDAVVQAGGNLGVFPKALSEQFKAVYTFEPDPKLFRWMTENAPEDNIVRFQAALGHTRQLVGTVMERRYKEHLPPHEGVTHVVEKGIIPQLRIDDLDLPICDLIYLDVEGREFHALRGAEVTILLRRPVIVVEVNQCCTFYGVEPEAMRAFLIGLGYRRVDDEDMRSDELYVPV
jgi:FkbM family methyltransferase